MQKKIPTYRVSLIVRLCSGVAVARKCVHSTVVLSEAGVSDDNLARVDSHECCLLLLTHLASQDLFLLL